MTMVIKICQGFLPGRRLVIISTPLIERPPTVSSRGHGTVRGPHWRVWLSLAHVDGGKVAGIDVRGLVCYRKVEID